MPIREGCGFNDSRIVIASRDCPDLRTNEVSRRMGLSLYTKQSRGIALLLSLVVMVILLVLGGAYMYMVRLEAYISKKQRDSTDAL